MRKNSFVDSFLVFLFALFVFFACTEKYQPQEPGSDVLKQLSQVSGCVDCHLDDALLQQVATPLPPDTGSSGEG